MTYIEAPDAPSWTYQNALRALGRHIDEMNYRGVAILQVAQGFIMRALPSQGSPEFLGIEVTDADLEALITKNFLADDLREALVGRSTLCPTGYEDFLRAIGTQLDNEDARNICVHELSEAFVITMHQRDSQGIWQFSSVMLSEPDIELVLNNAYGRRRVLAAQAS